MALSLSIRFKGEEGSSSRQRSLPDKARYRDGQFYNSVFEARNASGWRPVKRLFSSKSITRLIVPGLQLAAFLQAFDGSIALSRKRCQAVNLLIELGQGLLTVTG